MFGNVTWVGTTHRMTVGVILALVAVALLIGLTIYGRAMIRRRSRPETAGSLTRLEILSGWLGIGALGLVAGALEVADGSDRGEVAGVLLLLGGAVFTGYRVFASWWLRKRG